MAARRLLIVMLVLIGISSVIAIMVPGPNRDDRPPEESALAGDSGPTGATGAEGTTGEDADPGVQPDEVTGSDPDPELLVRTVKLGGKEPTRIDATAGQRLILTVESNKGSEVEVEGLGLTGFADQFAPAVFDVILPPDPGSYAVAAPGEDPSALIDSNT